LIIVGPYKSHGKSEGLLFIYAGCITLLKSSSTVSIFLSSVNMTVPCFDQEQASPGNLEVLITKIGDGENNEVPNFEG
jgi:hypothetical protein